MQPDTKYATVGDSRIAYQVFGAEAPTLLDCAGSFTHTDVVWEDPGTALFLTRLGELARVIRYDHMGTGNSDPMPPTWDAAWGGFPAEFALLAEQCDADRFVLWAEQDAGPAAIVYAAEHPEQVSGLILVCTAARFTQGDGYPYGFSAEEAQGLIRTLDEEWGATALQRITVPSRVSDPGFSAWYAKLLRAIGTPGTILASVARGLALDARAYLPRVAQPTLILHRSGYEMIPIGHARYLAEHLPNARLVELPGTDGALPWETPDLALEAIRSFLHEGARTVPRADRAVLTVLFTDIVRSTERASAMGDRDWNAVLRVHNELATSEVARATGRLVKFTGDGMLATFADPARALECALQLRTVLQRMDVPIRAGLHTGQVNVGPDDVDGLAVHIAARVMAAGGDGRVVVSRTVHDLLLGSAYRFASLGPQLLKGIEGEWELFETLG